MQTQETENALVKRDIEYIKAELVAINIKLDNRYTTREEHIVLQDRLKRVENVVYGFVALILIAVVGALLSLVLKQ